jgi:hypothetical protein
MNRLGRFRLPARALNVVGILVLSLLHVALLTDCSGPKGSEETNSQNPPGVAAPILGALVTANQQRAVTGAGRVPALNSVVLPSPCSGTQSTLKPLLLWANSTQIATNYSDGVWLVATPLGDFHPGALNGGIPPTPAGQIGVKLVLIRGQRGWLINPSQALSCPSLVFVGSTIPGSGRLPSESSPLSALAYMFPPSEEARIEWAERGYVIEIAGPFSATTLLKIADGLRWK